MQLSSDSTQILKLNKNMRKGSGKSEIIVFNKALQNGTSKIFFENLGMAARHFTLKRKI